MMRRIRLLVGLTLFSGALGVVGSLLFWLFPTAAQAVGAPVAGSGGEGVGLGYLSAALATGLSSLGAAYAVAHVGAAAVGAITEKPEIMGRVLILVGLAEGIAIYGIIISILILNKLA